MQLRPHHVGIVVSDLERSTAFYRALGFAVVQDIPWDDGSRAIRFLESGALQLELFWYAETPTASAAAAGKQLGFRHLAFLVDDIDVSLGELKAAGVVPADVEVRDVPLGFRIAFFNDPDGLEIELSQPQPRSGGAGIRELGERDLDTALSVINEAAEAYRGVIPADRWHEPYMSGEYLRSEIEAGVRFSGYEGDDGLLGVMGIQVVGDVTLIRHAYVRPDTQRAGIGGKLLRALLSNTSGSVLIGTWADADWAIAFYEKHGFVVVSPEEKTRLLRRYWDIPERQVETSVVLREAAGR